MAPRLRAGLRRSGKSCRLRWVNYLRPDLKRGKITPDEETVILQLHAMLGNRYVSISIRISTCKPRKVHVHVRKRHAPSGDQIHRA
jgi:hypothetical protein